MASWHSCQYDVTRWLKPCWLFATHPVAELNRKCPTSGTPSASRCPALGKPHLAPQPWEKSAGATLRTGFLDALQAVYSSQMDGLRPPRFRSAADRPACRGFTPAAELCPVPGCTNRISRLPGFLPVVPESAVGGRRSSCRIQKRQLVVQTSHQKAIRKSDRCGRENDADVQGTAAVCQGGPQLLASVGPSLAYGPDEQALGALAWSASLTHGIRPRGRFAHTTISTGL